MNLDQYWLMGDLHPALFQNGVCWSLLMDKAFAIMPSLGPGCEGPRARFLIGAQEVGLTQGHAVFCDTLHAPCEPSSLPSRSHHPLLLPALSSSYSFPTPGSSQPPLWLQAPITQEDGSHPQLGPTYRKPSVISLALVFGERVGGSLNCGWIGRR